MFLYGMFVSLYIHCCEKENRPGRKRKAVKEAAAAGGSFFVIKNKEARQQEEQRDIRPDKQP
jgi:hypothetical protein